MSPPNPFENEELYDAISLAGQRSPGQLTLSGHDRKIGWDIKKGPGQSGASMTRISEDPVAFTATFYLATVEDFAAWETFLVLIQSTVSGATPKALDIYHPDLASNGIKSVVLDTVMGTVHDGKGGQTVAVKFIEYKPPKPKAGAPKGSKAHKTAAPDPDAGAKAQLARLTEEYQRTPWPKR